jgi:cell division protein FtsL
MMTNVTVTGPFQNIGYKKALFTSCLGLLLITFAIGVVISKHKSRILYAKLQTINVEKERLNNEWNQLLLENATWTSALRVEKIASEQLQMTTPIKIEMIKP